LFCLMCILACLLPLLNILARSLSSADSLVKNEVLLLPKGLNFDAYSTVLGDSKVTWALLWTAILTAIVTVWSMFMTIMCAYPLTYENLKGKKTIMALQPICF
jgi:putative aldouronate transport system permease protein